MDIFFFSPTKNEVEKRLLSAIGPFAPGRSIDLCRSLERVSRTLRQPREDDAVAIIKVDRREELKEIISVHTLFRDVRIILIVPDREENTIALAHRLRPRLLAYGDSDFSEVSAVLKKIFGENHKP